MNFSEFSQYWAAYIGLGFMLAVGWQFGFRFAGRLVDLTDSAYDWIAEGIWQRFGR